MDKRTLVGSKAVRAEIKGRASTGGRLRTKPGDDSIAGRLLDLAETHHGQWWRRSELVDEYTHRWPGERKESVARVLARLISNGAFEVSEVGVRRSERTHLEKLPTRVGDLDAMIAELEGREQD